MLDDYYDDLGSLSSSVIPRLHNSAPTSPTIGVKHIQGVEETMHIANQGIAVPVKEKVYSDIEDFISFRGCTPSDNNPFLR